ncbi:cytochrome c oxidase subunit 7A2, mitochondrial-like [Ptychodera flava]|uniref:cytochrome c oxidase subunit 7A2, mitochondrial-like n=1 Tax=Ptychodera flava TaxID=63121 RepID=UPI003969F204
MRGILAARSLVPRARMNLSTSSRNSMQNRVYEKQKAFQEPNNIPIHLKGGVIDRILYTTTMVAAAGGTVWTFYEIFKASFPQPKQD